MNDSDTSRVSCCEKEMKTCLIRAKTCLVSQLSGKAFEGQASKTNLTESKKNVPLLGGHRVIVSWRGEKE